MIHKVIVFSIVNETEDVFLESLVSEKQEGLIKIKFNRNYWNINYNAILFKTYGDKKTDNRFLDLKELMEEGKWRYEYTRKQTCIVYSWTSLLI